MLLQLRALLGTRGRPSAACTLAQSSGVMDELARDCARRSCPCADDLRRAVETTLPTP